MQDTLRFVKYLDKQIFTLHHRAANGEVPMSDVDGKKSVKKPPAAQESEVAELAAFLATANKIANRLQTTALADLGIAIPDWLLLRVVHDEGRISMSEAARKIGVTRQRVHQQVAQLQASRLVTASEGEDGKSKALELAAAGRTLIAQVEKAIRDALAQEGEAPVQQIHAARRSAARVAKALVPRKAESEAA